MAESGERLVDAAPLLTWQEYVATWRPADIAVVPADASRVFAVSTTTPPGSAGILQVDVLDGNCPTTLWGSRRLDLRDYCGAASVGQQPNRKPGSAANGGREKKTEAGKPLAGVVCLRQDEESHEMLLILLSSGLLLALTTAHLAFHAVLGSFSDESWRRGAGEPLAVLGEIGWVAVLEGARVGLVPIPLFPDSHAGGGTSPGSGSPSRSAPHGYVELPRGLSASAVRALPARPSCVLVGCGCGRILFYDAVSASRASLGRLSLYLVQSFDMGGSTKAEPSTGSSWGIRSSVNGFVHWALDERASSSSSTPSRGTMRSLLQRRGNAKRPAEAVPPGGNPAGAFGGGTDTDVLDICTMPLAGGSDVYSLVIAAVGRRGQAGVLSVWQVGKSATTISTERSSSKLSGCADSSTPLLLERCLREACAAPLLRVLALAPGRMGCAWPLLLTLDGTQTLGVWAVRPTALELLVQVAGPQPSAGATLAQPARVFLWCGATHLLIAGNQVGWLDAAALLSGAALQEVAKPVFPGGHIRTCIGATFPSVQVHAARMPPVASEFFFLSRSALHHYSVATGRTAKVSIRMPSESVEEARLLAILDTCSSPPRGHMVTHLLVAALEKVSAHPPASAAEAEVNAGVLPPQSPCCLRSVWLVSSKGELLRRAANAFDATFLGPQVVWLARHGSGPPMACMAPAFVAAQAAADLVATQTWLASGTEHVLSCPVPEGQLLLSWGSRLPSTPLRVATLESPSTPQALALPQCGPMELVDARRPESPSGSGLPGCMAFAAAWAVWVVCFSGQRLSGELLAWLDLRRIVVARVLSLAWLRPPAAKPPAEPPPSIAGDEGALAGVVLISVPYGVIGWHLCECQKLSTVILCEHPQQLVAGAFVDRLFSVELQGCYGNGNGVFGAHDRPLNKAEVQELGLGELPWGPRARVRTRPVAFFEELAVALRAPDDLGDSVLWENVNWRMAPAEISSSLPSSALRALWPVASCSEAPSTLSCASAFYDIATQAQDWFRGLAALTCGLQSAQARPNARRGALNEEACVMARIEDVILAYRSDPAKLELLRCAVSLLLDCAAQAGRGSGLSGLALVSRGLAKHDLLPCGPLLAMLVLRDERSAVEGGSGTRQKSQAGIGIFSALAGHCSSPDALATPLWEHGLSAPAPLAAALLQRQQVRQELSRAPVVADFSDEAATDFSAMALLWQRYAELPPTSRDSISLVSGGHPCALYTATLAQWLGVTATTLVVRVFDAIQHESGTLSGSPRGAGSQQGRPVTPRRESKHILVAATVLDDGLLVYWRCADGEGHVARDSGGCGRNGVLRGNIAWNGPLPRDEPLEHSDEWGVALAPNWALTFGREGSLWYMPEEGGMGEEDGQMLSLVGGSRIHCQGQPWIQRIQGQPQGWTVELWVRLTTEAENNLLLFSRRAAPHVGGSGAGTSPALLAWQYQCKPPGFQVLLGTGGSLSLVPQELAEELLPEDRWVHIALRSNLQTVEIWVESQVVQSTPLPEGLSVDASGLCFGPAPGLEATEVRVWGVFRTDDELLEQQRQPLPCLLEAERRKDAWRKMRIKASSRSNTGPNPDGAGPSPGLWSLADLAAPASSQLATASRRRHPQRPERGPKLPQLREEEDQQTRTTPATPAVAMWEAWSSPWVTPPSADAPKGDSHAKAPPAAVPSQGAGLVPVAQVVPVAAPAPAGKVPPDDEKQGRKEMPPLPLVRQQLGSSKEVTACMPGPAGGAPPPPSGAPVKSAAQPNPSLLARPPPKAPTPPVAPLVLSPPKDEGSPGKAVLVSASSRERHAVPAEHQPRPRAPEANSALRAVLAEKVHRSEPLRLPGLREALPVPATSDCRGLLQVVDTALHVGAKSLEKHSYRFAEVTFHSALGQLRRSWLPARPAVEFSEAVHARFQAVAAYLLLGGLLSECDELQLAAGRGLEWLPSDSLCRLYACWVCVIHVNKAPHHTVVFALRAMAGFFSWGRHIGGWAAAQEVSALLLRHYAEALSEEQLEQVLYVREATRDGRVSRGASSLGAAPAAVGCCPSCGGGLKALATSCGACGAELGVCAKTRCLFDRRTGLYCGLCGAEISSSSPGPFSPPQHAATTRASVKALLCAVCGIGELLPRHSAGSSLAF